MGKTDWIMESDNVNVKGLYFSADTSAFTGTFDTGTFDYGVGASETIGEAFEMADAGRCYANERPPSYGPPPSPPHDCLLAARTPIRWRLARFASAASS